jgi:hypothetical protein
MTVPKTGDAFEASIKRNAMKKQNLALMRMAGFRSLAKKVAKSYSFFSRSCFLIGRGRLLQHLDFPASTSACKSSILSLTMGHTSENAGF